MPSADELYLRAAEVIIGQKIMNTPQEPPDAKLFSSILKRDPLDRASYESGFRISFQVDKDQESSGNKAKISLYNLSQESRNFVEDEKMIVFLKAGYQGGQISTIFFGDIQDRETVRNGPDVVTTLEVVDQGKLLDTANVQIGLGPGATNIQAFSAAEEAMGLQIPPRQKSLIPVKQFVNGFSFSGTARKLMEKLSREVDFKFSIQDGEIQIIGAEADDLQEAVLITPETGLIGSPTKTQRGAKFKSLLNPNIRVGRTIKLESKQFQGALAGSAKLKASQSLEDSGALVIPKKIMFNGDTWEGAWETSVEGIIPGTESVA